MSIPIWEGDLNDLPQKTEWFFYKNFWYRICQEAGTEYPTVYRINETFDPNMTLLFRARGFIIRLRKFLEGLGYSPLPPLEKPMKLVECYRSHEKDIWNRCALHETGKLADTSLCALVIEDFAKAIRTATNASFE